MNGAIFSSHIFNRYYQNLAPSVKNRKTQAYVMVVMSLLTISFFGVFAVRPTLRTISQLERQIQDRSDLNDRLDKKINALIQAQESYQAVESQLPLLYSLLPEQSEFPLLLKHLEVLAQTHEATISGIQFDPIVILGEKSASDEKDNKASTDTTTSSIPLYFTLAVNGDYDHLIAFLTQLTKLDRIVTIQSVQFAGGKGGVGQASLSLGIQSSAYYYPTNL